MQMGAERLRGRGFDLVYDCKKMLLHQIDCPEVKEIPSERLEGQYMSHMPRKVKYCPCPKCLPFAAQVYKERTTGLKGRQIILTLLANNKDKSYIKDNELNCIHRLHSPCLFNRPIRFLKPIETIPDHASLCKRCFSRYSDEAVAYRVRQEFSKTDAGKTLENLIRAITQTCASHNMFVEFVSKTAYITTVAGQWYFNLAQNPLELYHANYAKTEQGKSRLRYLQEGISYHKQDHSFGTAQDVLCYVVFHDDAMIRRMVNQKQEPIRTAEELENIIVACMEDKDLWDDTIADILGISEQAWMHYLDDGLKTMPLYLLEKLGAALDIDPDFFVGAIADIREWEVL